MTNKCREESTKKLFNFQDAVFEQWYFMKYTEAKEAKAKRETELEEKRQQVKIN